MISAGRHFKGESLGKDLAIADPATKMPVGLLPDFLDLDRTDEKYVERISFLYRGNVVQVSPEGSVCRHLPLDSVQLHVPDLRSSSAFC